MILKVVSCGITYFEDSKWFIATDLTSFPTIPFDAVRVNIDSSTIPAIRSADLSHLTAITSFYMWSNSIGVIESGAFQGLETLLDLSFWDSQILTIESNGFSGLSQLESLRFHSNNINTIETLTFSELPELTYLSFWYNNITTIQARAFVLPIEIDHWSNRIINLHEDAFVVEGKTLHFITLVIAGSDLVLVGVCNGWSLQSIHVAFSVHLFFLLKDLLILPLQFGQG